MTEEHSRKGLLLQADKRGRVSLARLGIPPGPRRYAVEVTPTGTIYLRPHR